MKLSSGIFLFTLAFISNTSTNDISLQNSISICNNMIILINQIPNYAILNDYEYLIIHD